MNDRPPEPFRPAPSRRLPPEVAALIRATAVRARARRRTAIVPSSCIFGPGASIENGPLDDDRDRLP